MKKMNIGKRLTSWLLVLAMLVSLMPVIALPAAAAEEGSNIQRVADPSTMDSWKNVFPITGVLSTENAGGVWLDKSVLTDASAFGGLITQKKNDSFLVALSTMASNMTITGMSHVPTDSVLVLDISGSMNDNSGNNDVAEELVEAANETIATLLATNKYNRVGVVLYSGPTTTNGAASANDAIVILPLGRYTTGADGKYLNYNLVSSGGRNPTTTESVVLDADVKEEGTQAAPTAKEKEVVGATYSQKGIALALDQFLAQKDQVVIEDPVLGSIKRKPVMVLMSDGAPTVGSTAFTAPNAIDLGSGSSTSAALGFVNQLTAAYAKAKMEEIYGNDALFYTLGLAVSNDAVAISVLDPDNANASTAVNDFWALYQQASVGGKVTVQSASWNQTARTVTKIETALEQNYVDQYFEVEAGSTNLAGDLKKAFQEIVGTIQLQSGYFPTLIAENEHLSGYVSFVDRVGAYMEVIDIKGVMIHNSLFSGANLASNFVSGGGALGTHENPTALGLEMVHAVRERLGLDSDDTARTLITLAYENGQLSYTDANNYSNYIGWYANAAGQFLGFYHEGVTQLPEATGNAATDPAFTIKSYGYLGEVDASHGVTESDMMYATVQVRENIKTGEQLVTFAVPAALVPIVTYEVTLDEAGSLADLQLSGAQYPIRLVYEVALQEHLDSFRLMEQLSQEYLADVHNVNADGSVNFYSNQWDHQNIAGYGTANAYGYFNPSRQNEKYYYQEDTLVYKNTSGALYTGTEQPSGELYRVYAVYQKDNGNLRQETVYRRLSQAAMETAQRSDDGTWYIPAGNVHVNLDGYTVEKTENTTQTLSESCVPFVDTKNHNVNEAGYEFYVGATLGNNGKLTMVPQTGIRLHKTVEGESDQRFTFLLTNVTDPQDATAYPALRILADGTEAYTTVQFADGKAQVQLAAEETLYIGGMKAGDVISVAEEEQVRYLPQVTGLTAEGTVTVLANTMAKVDFVNAERGVGNLTVAKEVAHDLGVDYNIPADKKFTMTVTLSGIGTANATFAAAHTNGTYTSVTTDENGRFTVELSHDEQFEIFGLPAGTAATVVESAYGAGFTPSYQEDGVAGDGIVTVVKDSTVSVVVINQYAPAEVYPVNITVHGTKILEGRQWQLGDSFQFQLHKLLPDGTWQQLGQTVEATSGNTSFRFADAFANERYSQAGHYYYRIIEIEPENPLGGITYDKTVHSFYVVAADMDMDGKLEISAVNSDRPESTVVTQSQEGWDVAVSFRNTYSTTGSATVTIDLNKVIDNRGGAEQFAAGFTFGLYQGEELVATSAATTDRGFARLVLTYGPQDVGKTITYTLKEIVPATIPAGWNYSTEEYTVNVQVSDNGDGTLSAVIYTGTQQPADASAAVAMTFTNTYDPKDAELAVDFVKKQLTGRDMLDQEFSFLVRNDQGEEILKGTNDTQGNVTFNGTLKFSAIGTYTYEILETSQDGKGVTTDKTVYRILVTVVDQEGVLSASYVLLNAVGDSVVFQNRYHAEAVEYIIGGSKILTGRTLINDEFTFLLTGVSYNGQPMENPVTLTTKNFMNGSFAFAALKLEQAGIYVYRVSEQMPQGGKAYGIHYDTTVYLVTLDVRDNGEGMLYIHSEDLTLEDGKTVESLSFVNKYVPEKTAAQFTGDKQLTGRVLGGEDFNFLLYASNAHWEKGEWLQTVTNDKSGRFAFAAIDFTAAENRYFLVMEENGGQTIDGVSYDSSVYHVYVEITDDLKGQLHAKVHIYDAEGVPQESILFINSYQITGTEVVNLVGNKTLEGREMTPEDSFFFDLYQADENFVPGQEPYLTAKADTLTGAYGMQISYTEADVGNTYYYVLKERNAGQTIDRVTYSTTEYRIKVQVEDNLTGGIRTVVTVENATVSTLHFVNVYTPKPADVPVEILVQKTVLNVGSEQIGPEDFGFLLEADGLQQTLRTDAQGMAKFGFTFTEEDIGKTYTYRLTEIQEDRLYVTYSKAAYEICITVSLNEENRLETAITVNGEAVQQAVAVFENIYDYTPLPPSTGDSTNLALWVMLMCLSSGAALMLTLLGKKQSKA